MEPGHEAGVTTQLVDEENSLTGQKEENKNLVKILSGQLKLSFFPLIIITP